ncbi:hypothetical protein NBRC116583_22670 [Arenicella sp. 4NH20-0111]|uniref:hypothetical protein n=1 Tax=Arenicella sp. 4NH20-0111 TaxID=3127648 RepID=UPI0031086CF7
MTIKTLLITLTLVSLTTISFQSNAKFAGKNLILVHGLKVDDFKNRPTDAQLPGLAESYWSEYWGNRAEAKLYWPATARITGRVKDLIRAQIKDLEARGTCAAGCVFLTHSAGDLVTRDALTRLRQWGVDPNRFKVLATLDLAGAGGGSELANLAINVSDGGGIISSIQRRIVKLFTGINPSRGTLGTVYDLRPSNARSIGRTNTGTPRLRFVGTGAAYLGVSRPFVKGNDDGVVGVHSTCGASSARSYDSCSRSVRDNGVLRSTSGPSSFMSNHYPILMGSSTDHFEIITNKRTGNYTTVTNGRTLGGIRLDFSTKTKRKWWALWRKVRQVKNGDRKSMSANIYDTLNR